MGTQKKKTKKKNTRCETSPVTFAQQALKAGSGGRPSHESRRPTLATGAGPAGKLGAAPPGAGAGTGTGTGSGVAAVWHLGETGLQAAAAWAGLDIAVGAWPGAWRCCWSLRHGCCVRWWSCTAGGDRGWEPVSGCEAPLAGAATSTATDAVGRMTYPSRGGYSKAKFEVICPAQNSSDLKTATANQRQMLIWVWFHDCTYSSPALSGLRPVLVRRHPFGHRPLVTSGPAAADRGLPSSHRFEDSDRPSRQTADEELTPMVSSPIVTGSWWKEVQRTAWSVSGPLSTLIVNAWTSVFFLFFASSALFDEMIPFHRDFVLRRSC